MSTTVEALSKQAAIAADVRSIPTRSVSSTTFIDMTGTVAAHIRERLAPDTSLVSLIHEGINHALGIFTKVKIHAPSIEREANPLFYRHRKLPKNTYHYYQHNLREFPHLVPFKGGSQHCDDEQYYYFSKDHVHVEAVKRPVPVIACKVPTCVAAYMDAAPADISSGVCSGCETQLERPAVIEVRRSTVAGLFKGQERQASRYVASAFRSAYPCEPVRVIDGPKDQGIDLTCGAYDDPYRYLRLIQVKSHGLPIGPKEVRELKGTDIAGADPDAIWYLVSLSGFTEAALGLAAEAGIACLDAAHIESMLDGWQVQSAADLNELCLLAELVEDRVGPMVD